MVPGDDRKVYIPTLCMVTTWSLYIHTLHGAYMVSVHTLCIVPTWSLYIPTRTHTGPGITIIVDLA